MLYLPLQTGIVLETGSLKCARRILENVLNQIR
jgi:hypothetical protein